MLIDVYAYFLHYLPTILLAAPVLYWAYAQLRTERSWRCVLIAAISIGGAVALILLAAGLAQASRHGLSMLRLASPAAWLRGYHLYYPLGQGPMVLQIYGPVSSIVYVPAALAKTPTMAATIGGFIDALFFIVPAAWFLIAARRGQRLLIVTVSLVAFILAGLRQFAIADAMTRVSIDTPAVGLATCALAVLVGVRGGFVSPSQAWKRGALCGLFAALAIWCKFTLGPVAIALPLYVLLAMNLRDALRFSLSMSISLAIVSLIMIIWFGPEMLFQTLIVPARHPLQWPGLTRSAAYERAAFWIWRDTRPLQWIAGGGILLGLLRAIPSARQQGRKRLLENPWLLPVITMLLVIPLTIIARANIGAAYNHVVPGAYLGLLGAAAAISGAAAAGESGQLCALNRIARIGLVMTILIATCLNADERKGTQHALAGWASLSDNEHEIAYDYARQHPRQVYFPLHPLSMLLAEGHAYCASAALDDLAWAGAPVSDQQFHASLPPDLKAVIFRGDSFRPNVMKRLPEFNKQVNVPELPGWIVLTRDGVAP